MESLDEMEVDVRAYVADHCADCPGWRRDAIRYFVSGRLGDPFVPPPQRANPAASAAYAAFVLAAWEAGQKSA